MEPASANVIVGQSHFIKTVEDLYEAVGGCYMTIRKEQA